MLIRCFQGVVEMGDDRHAHISQTEGRVLGRITNNNLL